MPIHDWKKVDAGLFHHVHKQWSVALCDLLNSGRLPGSYVALLERSVDGPTPDLAPLKAQPVEIEEALYARRANRIRIQNRHGKVVAVIEILSPGNKNNRHGLLSFFRKAADLIWQDINLLVVDLFPPSQRDPQGIHKAICDEIGDRPFELPPDKPLTVASYRTLPVKTAYVEPVAVGDALPAIPIFLTADTYVLAPLEEAYQTSWAVFPAVFKRLLEPSAREPSPFSRAPEARG